MEGKSLFKLNVILKSNSLANTETERNTERLDLVSEGTKCQDGGHYLTLWFPNVVRF